MFMGLFILSSLISESASILCYNCSSTNRDLKPLCNSDFLTVAPFSIKHLQFLNDMTINCTDEINAYCFVRSSRRRAHQSWIIQRGCYYPQSTEEQLYLSTRNARSHSSICEELRKEEREFSLCVCASDHCNGSAVRQKPFGSFVLLICIILFYIFIL